jgi:hypothetical protein
MDIRDSDSGSVPVGFGRAPANKLIDAGRSFGVDRTLAAPVMAIPARPFGNTPELHPVLQFAVKLLTINWWRRRELCYRTVLMRRKLFNLLSERYEKNDFCGEPRDVKGTWRARYFGPFSHPRFPAFFLAISLTASRHRLARLISIQGNRSNSNKKAKSEQTFNLKATSRSHGGPAYGVLAIRFKTIPRLTL